MEKALAQLTNPVLPPFLGGGDRPDYLTGGTVIGSIVSSLVGIFFIGGFVLAFMFLLTGAFFWITSGGDKSSLENARNRIVHAIVGLIVLASAWAIMTLVGDFIGLDFSKLPIPTIGTKRILIFPKRDKNVQFCDAYPEADICKRETF